jgi:hypothetical protein
MIRPAVALGLVFLLSACFAITIDELVPDSEMVIDARLIGEWEGYLEEDSSLSRAAISGGGRGYLIEYTAGNGQTGRFDARLGRLGSHLVLEVRPVEPGDDRPIEASLAVAAHLQLFLEIGADSVALRCFDPDELVDAVAAGTLHLRALRDSFYRTLVYGSTEELRTELLAFIERPEALSEPVIWRRVQ